MGSRAGQTVSGEALLETKLYVPRWRAGLVSRPRLVERLGRGAERTLTLVSAPAGFGKSTLLAEWLAGMPAGERGVGWVSLDAGDNDPARFWAYVVAALRTIHPGVGQGVLAALNVPQPPPIEAVLTGLVNELSGLGAGVVLVLDDLHVIEAPAVHGGIAFLLDHLPPRMHLVIASRSDPPLPLARLRGRGEATELRAADLRFGPDEAAEFLTGVMGLDLSAGDVATLEARTEGWIAGLQLAALSMRGRDDIAGFLREFAGHDRYIIDYLVEEVLGRQPERVRSFLLETALLDRLCGPLCDAVTGRDEGTEMLGALERGNLFVVPLDDRRRWYRYHHLFADVLQAHAAAERSDRVPVRHRLASEWFEANGLRADAIRHALAAEDVARAAGLVELAALPMLGSSQEETLYGWLRAIPDEIVRVQPVLSVYYAFAAFGREGFDAAEGRLRDAERWLAPAADSPGEHDGEYDTVPGPPGTASPGVPARSGEMVVVDEAAFRSLPGTIAVARAYRAGATGDVGGIVAYARRALEVLPEGDDLWRGAAAAVLGIGFWTIGELEAAHRSFAEGKARLERAGYSQFQIVSVHNLAEIRVAQGRLREAQRTYEQAMRLATEQSDPAWGTADLYVGLSGLHRERDDLEGATGLLLRSKELGEHAGLMDTRHRWYVAMARIKEAQGDFEGALDLLDEAERQYVPGADPDLTPVAALRARVWIAQGRLADALDWVREGEVAVGNDLSYLREFEHITLARVLLARYERERDGGLIADAVGLLDRLLRAAEAGERAGSVIEILILEAMACEARGDISGALGPLGRALALAEPEGYVRVFVAEGVAMRNLLRHAAARGIAPISTRRLLAAFDRPGAGTGSVPAQGAADLAEPLTAREVEILRLIAAGMRNQEIADQLFISLPTVKRHIANAYGKLGVGHRTEAVARATGLGVL